MADYTPESIEHKLKSRGIPQAERDRLLKELEAGEDGLVKGEDLKKEFRDWTEDLPEDLQNKAGRDL